MKLTDDAQQGRLAAAVGAKQCHHRAARDLEGDVAQDGELAVAGGDSGDGQDDLARDGHGWGSHSQPLALVVRSSRKKKGAPMSVVMMESGTSKPKAARARSSTSTR